MGEVNPQIRMVSQAWRPQPDQPWIEPPQQWRQPNQPWRQPQQPWRQPPQQWREPDQQWGGPSSGSGGQAGGGGGRSSGARTGSTPRQESASYPPNKNTFNKASLLPGLAFTAFYWANSLAIFAAEDAPRQFEFIYPEQEAGVLPWIISYLGPYAGALGIGYFVTKAIPESHKKSRILPWGIILGATAAMLVNNGLVWHEFGNSMAI